MERTNLSSVETLAPIRDQAGASALYGERGYVGPRRILTSQQCRRFLAAVGEARVPPLDWEKGLAAAQRAFYELGTLPAILDVVADLIGDDVILWGASIQRRAPSEVHPWHSDIESDVDAGETLAVWIGLEHTTRDSSLLMVPYSHRFGVTIQEVRHQMGVARADVASDVIAEWARSRDDRSEVLKFDMTDGDAMFFDGRLWHGSHNVLARPRKALLLQYATPDAVIRIPDLNHLDWPFSKLEMPRPPCLLVRGTDGAGVNRIVSAPVTASARPLPQLTSRVYPLPLPLEPDTTRGWKPYPVFRGITADFQIGCHASALTSGTTPHPPHAHIEEELLLLMDGEVELDLPDVQGSGARPHLMPGDFVYYPAHFTHTLTTASAEPANYLMLKWSDPPSGTHATLPYGRYRAFDGPASTGDKGFSIQKLFEGPTAHLRKLQCHASTLMPGAGYEPHADAYDVAIVVLEGEVETLGQRVGPCAVIFYRAGERHGMRNPGSAIARYLVFEFHGQSSPDTLSPGPPWVTARRFVYRLVHRGWRTKLKRLIGRRQT